MTQKDLGSFLTAGFAITVLGTLWSLGRQVWKLSGAVDQLRTARSSVSDYVPEQLSLQKTGESLFPSAVYPDIWYSTRWIDRENHQLLVSFLKTDGEKFPVAVNQGILTVTIWECSEKTTGRELGTFPLTRLQNDFFLADLSPYVKPEGRYALSLGITLTRNLRYESLGFAATFYRNGSDEGHSMGKGVLHPIFPDFN